jgi:MSHA biogenesis protein MshQ
MTDQSNQLKAFSGRPFWRKLSLFLWATLLVLTSATHVFAACSEYMGRATINEVYFDNNDHYVEFKLLDGNIPASVYGDWSYRVCNGNVQGWTSCSPYVSVPTNSTNLPWIVDQQVDRRYLDFSKRMDILLVDGNGWPIDYLSVNLLRQWPWSCNFAYDTTANDTSSFILARFEDGTGDWMAVSSGNSGDETEEDSNDVVNGQYWPRLYVETTTVFVGETAYVVLTLIDENGDVTTSNTSISFAYTTEDGTALSGQDYAATSGIVTIAAGVSQTSIPIDTYNSGFLTGDSLFYLHLSDPSGVTLLNNYPQIVLKPLPAASHHWPFDSCDWQGSSSEVDDVVGANDGTAMNGMTTIDVATVTGPLCRAATFDGVDDYIAMQNALNPLRGTATLSFWVRTTQVGDNTAWRAPGVSGVEQDAGTNDIFWGFIDGTGHIGVSIGNNSGVKSSSVINDGIFHHVVLTRHDQTGIVQVYVDGQLSGSGTLPTGQIGNSFSSLGRVENTNATLAAKYFAGTLDEVMIYDEVLSSSVIERMYENYIAGRDWDGSERECDSCKSFCFSDDFNRNSLGDSWTIIKQDNFTPQITNGKLILTSSKGYISSGVTLKGSYPSQDNYVEIEFEHNAYDGNGADGVVLVLSDASVVPVAGAYGGSLGYANRTGENGFAGGWLGFGLDEFGNFSNPTEGRNGGPGRVRDAIVIRGHGDTQNDYKYITGTSSLNPGVDNPYSSSPAPGYRYRFSIDTRTEKTLLKVERDTGSGYSTVIDWKDVTQTSPAPENFRVSFTASTGASDNIHSIDDFTMNALYCGTIGEGEIDHFLFLHDGEGLTCAAEEVTLVACANSDCTQVYTGDIQVQLPDLGWLDGTIQTLTFPASGQVTLKLKHTTAETVALGVIVSTPDASSSTQCTGGSPDSCDLTFYDSGFLIDVEDGRSCTDLNGTIQAVRSDLTSQLCVGDDSFADTTRGVGFWFDYQDPATGSVVPWLEGQALGQLSPGTAVDMAFDSEAKAAFTLSYRDAGSLTLSAQFTGSDDEAGLVMTGNTTAPFIVAPAAFEVSSALDNTATTGTPKQAAGTTFGVTVQAVCSDGTVTENFAWPTLLFISDSEPVSAGALSNGSLLATEFSQGEAAPTDLSYSEVGNITLTALAENYLGSTMDVTGTSGIIGRFHPHHFSIEANSPTLTPGCTIFSYLNQPLGYTVAPQLTISARNAAGGVTSNYVGSWWHLADLDEGYVDAVASALAVTVDDTLAGHSPATTAADAATPGQVVVDFNGPLAYQPPTGTNVAPFSSALFLSFDLDDGDAVYDGGNPYRLALPFDPAGSNEIRHGRLSLVNAHGSELLPLSLPVVVEYFNGSTFVINSDDNCTSLLLSDFTFTPSLATLAAADSLTAVGAGNGSVDWTNPDYPVGYVDVLVDLSTGPYWLQYDWDGDGSVQDPPAARATFGIYKGSEQIIYLRETTWH